MKGQPYSVVTCRPFIGSGHVLGHLVVKDLCPRDIPNSRQNQGSLQVRFEDVATQVYAGPMEMVVPQNAIYVLSSLIVTNDDHGSRLLAGVRPSAGFLKRSILLPSLLPYLPLPYFPTLPFFHINIPTSTTSTPPDTSWLRLLVRHPRYPFGSLNLGSGISTHHYFGPTTMRVLKCKSLEKALNKLLMTTT